MRVVVTGGAGSVGSRVIERLLDRPSTEGQATSDPGAGDPAAAEGAIEVVGIDRIGRPVEGLADHHLGDLRSLDLDAIFDGADVVVHLASAYGRNQFVDASSHDTRAARLVFEAAARSGVGQCVLLSSAMVYGARAENPIPLTEHAPLQPAGLAFAESKVTIERLGRDWQAQTGGRLVVLRPSTAVARGGSSWVARSLQLAAALSSDSDPDLQFLHLNDLADAVVLTVRQQADGDFNVAPDGWVRADEVRSLSGRAPRVRIPSWVADEVVRFSWNRGIVATPPGIMPYATFPWVVANDRLRDLGWEPSYSNVEAYVEGYEARPWAMINAKQRQQMALGGAAVGIGTALAVGRSLSRRWR